MINCSVSFNVYISNKHMLSCNGPKCTFKLQINRFLLRDHSLVSFFDSFRPEMKGRVKDFSSYKNVFAVLIIVTTELLLVIAMTKVKRYIIAWCESRCTPGWIAWIDGYRVRAHGNQNGTHWVCGWKKFPYNIHDERRKPLRPIGLCKITYYKLVFVKKGNFIGYRIHDAKQMDFSEVHRKRARWH